LKSISAAEEAVKAEKAGAREMARNGVSDFLNGRYAEAIRTLDTALQKDPACGICRFFLGCSYAALYLLSGDKDQESLGKAQAAFKQLIQDQPNFSVDKSYVSPRIWDIYQHAIGK
jgi:tetratricopeptide (TPR) repeat protein